ncbi:protein of unknown function [Georgfuchsia toluolica]|uniref:Uncharacterized protein n=1 Tax=Georgfuchsia toluolica TaxID=424218 RepID=A0A916J480_9PROT|nr:protein of unknown function [Georgfuchsia toluolica]
MPSAGKDFTHARTLFGRKRCEFIEDTVLGENFVRVKTVFMEIGRLSCMAPDALRCIRFCGARVLP